MRRALIFTSLLSVDRFVMLQLHGLSSTPLCNITTMFLRFFLRARSRSNTVGKTSLGKFISARCLSPPHFPHTTQFADCLLSCLS